MVSEVQIIQLEDQSQKTAGRRVAIIDDAFIPLSLDRISEAERDDILELLRSDAVVDELVSFNIDQLAPVDLILEALTDPGRTSGLAVSKIIEKSHDLGRMIEERQFIRGLGHLIKEHTGNPVIECDPRDVLPDLTECDLVLIDYYLDVSTGNGELAKEIARQAHGQPNRPRDQQIVLMSSFESVREHRAEFRSDTKLSGASFAFVAKPDMNERWKIKAHFGMLDRARPHAPILEAYRVQLETNLREAVTGLLGIAADLDIGDIAYLQSQALMNDGHPLGDYISWLLSSHLTTLTFETDQIRKSQREVDKLEFEKDICAQ